jgi:hypothetical protein
MANQEQEQEIQSLRYQLELGKIRSIAPLEHVRSLKEFPRISTLPGKITPKTGSVARVMSPDSRRPTNDSMFQVVLL